jgi:formylglycine-generating enzyme required for sulfatase activity
MIGKVWEWTTDWYVANHPQQKSCCMLVNPRGPRAEDSYDPCQPKHQDSAQGDQRRLASLCTQLLPALSTARRGTPSRSTPRPAISASAASDATGDV